MGSGWVSESQGALLLGPRDIPVPTCITPSPTKHLKVPHKAAVAPVLPYYVPHGLSDGGINGASIKGCDHASLAAVVRRGHGASPADTLAASYNKHPQGHVCPLAGPKVISSGPVSSATHAVRVPRDCACHLSLS
jgi:hypothetical protein